MRFTSTLGDTFEYEIVEAGSSAISEEAGRALAVLDSETYRYTDEIARLCKTKKSRHAYRVIITRMETDLGFSASEKHRNESLKQLVAQVRGDGLILLVPKEGCWTERAEHIADGAIPETLNPGFQKFHENHSGATRPESVWNLFGSSGFLQIMDNDFAVPKPCLGLVLPYTTKKGLAKVRRMPKIKLSQLLRASEMGENRFVAVHKDTVSRW